MHDSSFEIHRVRSPEDLTIMARLLHAYASSLPIDLSYQNFSAEVSSMPGEYGPPAGELLLASDSRGASLGCVALRSMASPGCCEMKRLYVIPEARGLGLGRALVSAIIHEATSKGYTEMRLDTLSSMTAAIRLYQQSGFREISAYYETPIANTVFFSRRLTPPQ